MRRAAYVVTMSSLKPPLRAISLVSWTAVLALLVLAAACKATPPQEGKKCRGQGVGTCLDATHIAECVDGRWAVDSCLGPAGCKELAASFRCDQSIATVGTRCHSGQGACTQEGKQLLRCVDGKMAVEAACGGPDGCKVDGASSLFRCDQSVATAGDLCSDQGKSACSPDHAAMLTCKADAFATDLLCKGPQGCHIEGTTVLCDMSLADVGDPCTQEGTYACTTDHKRALQCKGGRLSASRSCKKGCETKNGDVYCT